MDGRHRLAPTTAEGGSRLALHHGLRSVAEGAWPASVHDAVTQLLVWWWVVPPKWWGVGEVSGFCAGLVPSWTNARRSSTFGTPGWRVRGCRHGKKVEL